jgi:hypothetical protein
MRERWYGAPTEPAAQRPRAGAAVLAGTIGLTSAVRAVRAVPLWLLCVALAATGALPAPAAGARRKPPASRPAPARPTVAVLPFAGLHAEEPQAAVLRALGNRAIACKPTELGRLRPLLMVTGAVVRRDKGLSVEVDVASPDGNRAFGQVAQPVGAGRHLTADQLAELGRQVDELVDAALAQRSADPPAGAAAHPVEPSPPPAAGTSDGPATATAPSLTSEGSGPRVYPWLEAAVGALVTSRTLSLSPSRAAPYSPGIAAGLDADVTFYPLAWSRAQRGGLFAGLGAFVHLALPWWPGTEVAGVGRNLATAELRLEGGARWRFVVLRRAPRLELTAIVGVGRHSFTIARPPDLAAMPATGPPDVAYVYGLFGGGIRLHLAGDRLVPWLSVAYEYVADAGPVEDGSAYGFASAYGIVGRAGLDLYVWRRLRVGAAGFYERLALSFADDSASARHAQGMTDQYFGGTVSLAYDY